MSSRDQILEMIRRNRPEAAPPPMEGAQSEWTADPVEGVDTVFESQARAAGAEVHRVSASELQAFLRERFAMLERTACLLEGEEFGDVSVTADMDPHGLEPLSVLICRGTLGVAENGAVWMRESDLGNRAAPFLAEHLVLVLSQERIVDDLHAAYDRIAIDEEGFGIFIAGPSKTADIEQVLVIGAHGPKRHSVVLVEGNSDA